jgi:prolipoprotein diacylglyceryltransferase
MLIALARFVVEFFREPDAQLRSSPPRPACTWASG